MQCSNGHENPDGQPFCGTCGEKLSTAEPPQAAAPPPPASAPPPPPTPGGFGNTTESSAAHGESRKGLGRGAKIAIAAGAVVVLLIAVVAVSSGSGDDDKAIAAAEDDSADEESTEPERTTTTKRPTTTVPATSTTTTPEEGTRDNPDPLGELYEVTANDEEWEFKIDSVNFDGWPSIQAENQFNDPPPDGWRWVLLAVSLNYVDGDAASHPGYVVDVSATGSASRIYTEYNDEVGGGCGVIPNDLTNGDELLPGGSAAGNICLPIPDAEITNGSLRLLLEPQFSFDDDPIWVMPFT